MRFGCLLSFCVGFSVTFNVQFPPGSASGARLSDLLAVLAFGGIFAFSQSLKINLKQFSFFVSGIFFFTILTIFEAQSGGVTFVIPLRWVIAFITILQLVGLGLHRQSRMQIKFMHGIVLGALFSLIVSAAQDFGFQTGLTAADANIITANLISRAAGLYEHPNANAHCMMLGAAALLQISFNSRAYRISIFASFALMVLGIFFTTGTRSIAIAAIVLVFLFIARIKFIYAKISYLIATVSFCVIVGIFYGDIVVDRIFGVGGADYLYGNSSVRFATTLAGLLVILNNPLGLGIFQQRLFWQSGFGTDAVHNGLFYGFVVFGWGFALIAIPYLYNALRFLGGSLHKSQAPFGFVIISALCSLMFEDLTVNPSFTMIMVLGASQGLLHWKQRKFDDDPVQTITVARAFRKNQQQ